MVSYRLKRYSGLLAFAACLVATSNLYAFDANGRWTTTASGTVQPLGFPVTLTWSIVPDGTSISHLGVPSNLVAFLDGIFPGGSGTNFEQRPWFTLLEQSFNRWSELSGVTFIYEPNDDGVGTEMGGAARPHGLWLGQLGARGDVRLGGANIDGIGGALATAGFIPNADITVDTSELAYYSAPGASNNYINLRNTLTHEIGHSLGLGHITSNNAAFLMETVVQASPTFDGPQMDDILGIHYQYGDVNEKSNGGLGNGTIANATSLGVIGPGQSVSRGTHAATGTVVLASETDFVSISNSNDVDFYSFTITEPSLVDLTLTPLGPTYHHVPVIGGSLSFNTSTLSNLSLELYALEMGNPVLLAAHDFNPAGQPETIVDYPLAEAGTYFARVAGSSNMTQFYRLTVSVDTWEVEPPLWGDFNGDGLVDAADYTVWRNNLGTDFDLNGNGDENGGSMGTVDAADYALWKMHFGTSAGTGQAGFAGGTIPEPSGLLGALAAALLLFAHSRRLR